jgi:hypothetical protein
VKYFQDKKDGSQFDGGKIGSIQQEEDDLDAHSKS